MRVLFLFDKNTKYFSISWRFIRTSHLHIYHLFLHYRAIQVKITWTIKCFTDMSADAISKTFQMPKSGINFKKVDSHRFELTGRVRYFVAFYSTITKFLKCFINVLQSAILYKFTCKYYCKAGHFGGCKILPFIVFVSLILATSILTVFKELTKLIL